jgi:EAL domain-containing protein (putative c-di-GMP-specific phosphodiesterase class I)
LIVPIGRWALREACREAVRWRRAYPRLPALPVSVNLSARQFAYAGLVTDVREAIADSGIDPAGLWVEITETVLMEEGGRVVEVLDALRALGVRVGLDDFGTGYSSLGYLQRFPLDGLKLDRSFVAALGERPESRAIVAAVIDMARTLGLPVVAEGVETEDQFADLRSLACGYAQGYYFARPLPADELGSFLERRTALARGGVVIAG